MQISWHVSSSVYSATCTCSVSSSQVERNVIVFIIFRGFGVDAISACRKLLGSRAMLADAWLGDGSFVANATCAAEGDNTVMELKVCIHAHAKLAPVAVF